MDKVVIIGAPVRLVKVRIHPNTKAHLAIDHVAAIVRRQVTTFAHVLNKSVLRKMRNEDACRKLVQRKGGDKSVLRKMRNADVLRLRLRLRKLVQRRGGALRLRHEGKDRVAAIVRRQVTTSARVLKSVLRNRRNGDARRLRLRQRKLVSRRKRGVLRPRREGKDRVAAIVQSQATTTGHVLPGGKMRLKLQRPKSNLRMSPPPKRHRVAPFVARAVIIA